MIRVNNFELSVIVSWLYRSTGDCTYTYFYICGCDLCVPNPTFVIQESFGLRVLLLFSWGQSLPMHV